MYPLFVYYFVCVCICVFCVFFVLCVVFLCSFFPSVFWYGWLGFLTCKKNRLPYNLYCVGGDVNTCTIQSNRRLGRSVTCVRSRLCYNVASVCLSSVRNVLWLNGACLAHTDDEFSVDTDAAVCRICDWNTANSHRRGQMGWTLHRVSIWIILSLLDPTSLTISRYLSPATVPLTQRPRRVGSYKNMRTSWQHYAAHWLLGSVCLSVCLSSCVCCISSRVAVWVITLMPNYWPKRTSSLLEKMKCVEWNWNETALSLTNADKFRIVDCWSNKSFWPLTVPSVWNCPACITPDSLPACMHVSLCRYSTWCLDIVHCFWAMVWSGARRNIAITAL